MTNVLVFTSLFPNAVKPDFGVFIKNRMHAYACRENCHVTVVAPVPYAPAIRSLKGYYEFSQIPDFEVIDGMKVYHPRYPLIPKISMPFHGRLMYHASIRLIKKLHQKFLFDLIDAHFVYPDGQAGVRLGKFFNLPVIVSARGTDINQYIYFPLIIPQITETLSQASQVISVCAALKDLMVGLGINQEKIKVIPNGVNGQCFYPLNRQKARRGLGIPAGKKIILSVGSLIRRKGHDLTIKAVKNLVDSGQDVQLYVLGTGEEKANLELLIFEQGLQDRVFLKGHIPNNQLLRWYNAADIFCLASSREGWANVLMESLACGTPVVATDVFGASEIIQSDAQGILVSRTEEDIFRGIETGLIKSWDHNQISSSIRIRSWQVVAKEVNDLFDDAITAHRQKSRR